ncbi:MAG: nucleotide exchange factor GrpE [Anaerolineales bacterium]|uniref:Protein GrpE n=1 Tax=Candidatus Desulfolinea nitratireducens TaxID=2841698 RepID=A0A8J6TF99_9CHLR|nr:nucleotide exchange factor GrpE [Candidatus Desulfolinea nitratireducens]MBL6961227.1 nucleotide exchange factor GrpE [Anaerolineales bacterium]
MMAESKKNKNTKDNKDKKEQKEQSEKQANAEGFEARLVGVDEYQALKQELEDSKAEVVEKQDELLRSLAEFSNYKKRIDRDQALKYQTMKGDIIKRFLPAMDDMARALQNAPEDPWVEGIQLIYRKLEGVLEAEGITRIEAENADFDPNFHEAIAQTPSAGHESGQVIEVLAQGYMLGERVIRPAMVRVAE